MHIDADPGPQRDSCVVAAMDKSTGTTCPVEKKGQCGHSLKRRAPGPLTLDRLLLLSWAHYSEDGPHLLCTGSFRWLQKTRERVLPITSEKKDISRYKGKSG